MHELFVTERRADSNQSSPTGNNVEATTVSEILSNQGGGQTMIVP